MRDIAAELMALKTDGTKEDIKNLFCLDYGYQTPKVDTRAAIFRDDKILLVCERDGRWTLPGGWCEYNLTPAENAVKEAREEAGREVEVKELIAVQTKLSSSHPRYTYNVVKFFFMCEEKGGEFIKNTETSAAEYFGEDELPVLSVNKASEEQIKMCFEAHGNGINKVLFD